MEVKPNACSEVAACSLRYICRAPRRRGDFRPSLDHVSARSGHIGWLSAKARVQPWTLRLLLGSENVLLTACIPVKLLRGWRIAGLEMQERGAMEANTTTSNTTRALQRNLFRRDWLPTRGGRKHRCMLRISEARWRGVSLQYEKNSHILQGFWNAGSRQAYVRLLR